MMFDLSHGMDTAHELIRIRIISRLIPHVRYFGVTFTQFLPDETVAMDQVARLVPLG